MKMITALLLLLPGLTSTAQDGKKYKLKLSWQPVVGHKTALSEDITEATKLFVRVGDQVLNRHEKKEVRAFRAVEEILEIKGKEAVRKTWTFSKAVRKQAGQDVPYGFEGKTVAVNQDKEGAPVYAYQDGGKPSAEDLKARQLIEARTEADAILRATDKAFSLGGQLIGPEETATIQAALAALKDAKAGDDHHAIRAGIAEVEKVTHHLAEVLMDESLKAALRDKKMSDFS